MPDEFKRELKREVRRQVKLEAEREEERWLRLQRDPASQQEWLRQNSLIYGGLIVIGVYMIQPFLTADELDLSAKICVVAFALAIPLLAALIMLNSQEMFRRRATSSRLVEVTKVVAQNGAVVGVVAGFWHILWLAGAGVVVAGLVAVGVHSAGYMRLERGHLDAAPPADGTDAAAQGDGTSGTNPPSSQP